MKRIIGILTIVLSACSAHATTWGSVRTNDPISGAEMSVGVYLSYGSYIYQWPSKYDLVFWPHTDEAWIWFSTNSGYASFGDDFGKLGEPEKARLSQWLAENYDPANMPSNQTEKLLWLERVYSQRDKDDDFWCHFFRLQAFVRRDDRQVSLKYVQQALRLLVKKLATEPEGMPKLETLYLLGEYNRRLGNGKDARRYFQELRTATYPDDDGSISQGHKYLLSLVRQRRIEQLKGTLLWLLPCILVPAASVLMWRVLRKRRAICPSCGHQIPRRKFFTLSLRLTCTCTACKALLRDKASWAWLGNAMLGSLLAASFAIVLVLWRIGLLSLPMVVLTAMIALAINFISGVLLFPFVTPMELVPDNKKESQNVKPATDSTVPSEDAPSDVQ